MELIRQIIFSEMDVKTQANRSYAVSALTSSPQSTDSRIIVSFFLSSLASSSRGLHYFQKHDWIKRGDLRATHESPAAQSPKTSRRHISDKQTTNSI
jgi:hypothetical protein